jgi:hypothetical protein
MMRHRFYFAIICLLHLIHGKGAQAQKDFNRAEFYEAMATQSLNKVDSMLNVLESSAPKGKDAYQGALLMKRAGLVSNPKNKLNLFKSGRRKLEDALSRDSLNAEFHFLRLMIQEHSPKILHYNKELENDSQIVGRLFKNLPPVVQSAVKDYSRTSKILKPESF